MRATTIIASAAAALGFSAGATGAELRCDSPGVAPFMVRDIFAGNASAKQLGLTVDDVTLLDVDDTDTGAVCLVSVRTNRGFSLRYYFRLSPDGTATLDLAP